MFNISKTKSDLGRIHNYIHDNLDRAITGAVLLGRYKKRCEWYEKDLLLEVLHEKDSAKNIETKIKKLFMKFLFDSGIFPIAESIFGGQIPDIVGLHRDEIMPIEVKIYKNSTSPILKGFNQIVNYTATLDETYGYYIIFNKTNKTFDVPGKIEVADKVIQIFVINLQGSPSKTKVKIVKITKKSFLGAYKKSNK